MASTKRGCSRGIRHFRASEIRASNWKSIVETYLERGARAFVLPSSFVVTDDRIAHVAVYPRTVSESIVVTTRLAPRSPSEAAAGLAAAAQPPPSADVADLFHAALDRAIAAHPRRLL